MAGKRSNFFQLIEELHVGLGDFVVVFVVSMGEGAGFGVSDLLVFGDASVVEGQLILSFLPDLL